MKKSYKFLLFMIIIFLLTQFTGCSFSIEEKIEVNQKEKESQMQSKNEESDLFFNEPKKQPKSTLIKVYKELRILELYGEDKLIGRFKIALGGSPVGDKNVEGDGRTPEGEYYICTRNDKSKFTLFLGLSYPNIEDAKRGLNNGILDEGTFQKIKKAIEKENQPPWNTPLGGAVGIHGKGNKYDWTLGCIALSDEDIKILWKYTPIKTKVLIYK